VAILPSFETTSIDNQRLKSNKCQSQEEVYQPLLEINSSPALRSAENKRLTELADKISTLKDKIKNQNFSEIPLLCQHIRTIINITA
jgi:hypothetical protein